MSTLPTEVVARSAGQSITLTILLLYLLHLLHLHILHVVLLLRHLILLLHGDLLLRVQSLVRLLLRTYWLRLRRLLLMLSLIHI